MLLPLGSVPAVQFPTSSALAGQRVGLTLPYAPIGSLVPGCVIDVSRMVALHTSER
jgi:hypothetical protein